MALTQPILNSIAAFDATQEHIFSFISIGGDQVLGSQLTIYDNETGSQVYQGNYTSFKFEYPLPAGTLTNGKYYNATISTINNASEFSEPSSPVAFYCYTAPVLTITNIPASGTIEQSNYTFQGNYVQAEGELLNGYQYTLYDSNKEQISQSAILYDGLYQYTFSGMANDTSYYVELSGSTINNTPVSSGLLLFTIRYIQPASFAICDLVNNCQNGFIQISSNIVSIDGKSEPDPPKYIDNKEVDLTDDGSWVQWDEGFNIQNDFTMRIWGRSFGDNEPIVTMKNELDTNNAPNRIEMKFMATDIIDTLPNYIFAEGDIVTTENAVNEPITDLNIGGNSYQKVVQASSESVKFESDNGSINDANPKLGAELDIEGNSYQETTSGYQLFNWNGVSNSAIATYENGVVKLTWTGGFDVFFLNNSEQYLNDLDTKKEYTISFKHKGNAIRISNYATSQYNVITNNDNDYAKYSFTVTGVSYIRVNAIRNEASGTAYIKELMVYEGTEDKSYEPYTGGTPSPNPDYPQDIEVVDGCNLFEINQEHSEFNKQVYIYKYYLKPNTNYTVSTNAPKTNIASLYFNGTSSIANGVYLNSSKTFMSDDKGYLFILIRFVQGTDSINLYQKLLDGTYYIQFNEGSITKPYLPYGSIGLKQSGKNLFDNTLKGYGHYGYTVKTITNGIRITAENDFTKSDALFGVYTIIDLSNYIGKVVRMQADIIPNKSTGAGAYRLGLSNKDSTNRKALAETGTKKEISFTVPELIGEQKYLAIWFYIGTTDSGTKGDYTDYTNIIVTIDNEDMTYEPYHEPKVISVNLNGNTLAKVGDVKDILKVNRNGEVEIEKKVGKINLKDITVWYQDKELSNSNRFYTNEIIYANSNLTLSNYFKYSNIQNINTVDEQGLCAANNRQIALRINKTLVTNVNELKQWLLEHDVEVYYQLATPQIITLPSIEPIELWQGTNIFKLITNLETVFSITYNIIDASPAPDNPSEVHFAGDIGNQIDFPDTSVSYTDGLHVAAKPNNNYILLPNRVYTLNFDYVVTNSTTDIYYGIGYGTKDNYVGALTINGEENIQYATQNKGSNSVTFQTPATFEGVDTPYLWIDFAKTTITATVAVDISNVSLYFGEYTEYQTYGRYNVPFKILGQNLFNYQKLLYFIDNNTTHEVISNGYSVNPTVQNSDCYVSIGYTNNLVAGEKYTLSYQTLGNVTSFNLYAVEKGTLEIANEITLTNGVFVAPDNNYDLMLKFTLDSSNLTNNVNIWNIQIVKGEELLDYATYTENGLNMDFEKPLRGIGNVRDYILLDNVNLINPTTLRANVKENTTYYFSSSTSNSYLLEFYNIENNLIDTEDISSGTFTTPANCVYVTSEDFTTLNVIPEHIQIEEGNTFSQYFPYISQPSVIRNIRRLVLTGNENFEKNTNYTTDNMLVAQLNSNDVLIGTSAIISNYFKYANPTVINSTRVAGSFLLFGLDITEFAEISSFKQWVADKYNNGKPVIVYYLLSTPQVYNLSGDYEKVLRNFATQVGTNNILIDSQYPGYLRLKYANSYTEQGTKANYVLLKCWNENTIPYMVHSNYITVKSPKDKIFIWTRRKNNIFDLKIENLGEE